MLTVASAGIAVTLRSSLATAISDAASLRGVGSSLRSAESTHGLGRRLLRSSSLGLEVSQVCAAYAVFLGLNLVSCGFADLAGVGETSGRLRLTGAERSVASLRKLLLGKTTLLGEATGKAITSVGTVSLVAIAGVDWSSTISTLL